MTATQTSPAAGRPPLDGNLVSFLKAVKPEWTSWDILRATNKLSKIDCHTPQDVMSLAESGSLNVRLMAHGEKPFFEKTIIKMREVYALLENGEAAPRPGTTPRGLRPGGPRQPKVQPDPFQHRPLTPRDAAERRATTPRKSPAARTSPLRSGAAFRVESDSDSDLSSLGFDEDTANRMADFMKAQSAHIRANVARTQREIDELVHRVRGNVKKSQAERSSSGAAARAPPGSAAGAARRPSVPTVGPTLGGQRAYPEGAKPPSRESDRRATTPRKGRAAPPPRSAAAESAERNYFTNSVPRAQQEGFRFGDASFRFGAAGGASAHASTPGDVSAPRKTCPVETALRQELNQVRALPDEARKRELKKLAVKWHPDRNKENPELATRLFQMINF